MDRAALVQHELGLEPLKGLPSRLDRVGDASLFPLCRLKCVAQDFDPAPEVVRSGRS
jgi:hypothetical protein